MKRRIDGSERLLYGNKQVCVVMEAAGEWEEYRESNGLRFARLPLRQSNGVLTGTLLGSHVGEPVRQAWVRGSRGDGTDGVWEVMTNEVVFDGEEPPGPDGGIPAPDYVRIVGIAPPQRRQFTEEGPTFCHDFGE